MTPEQFVYWLQGYAEIDGAAPDTVRWQIIRDHLALVFDKKTPAYAPGLSYPPGVRSPAPAVLPSDQEGIKFPPMPPPVIWPQPGTAQAPWIEPTRIIC